MVRVAMASLFMGRLRIMKSGCLDFRSRVAGTEAALGVAVTLEAEPERRLQKGLALLR